MIAALALFFAIGIGGTLAYLNSITDEVTNTFTMGNINIKLKEEKAPKDNIYKLTPGVTTDKDPKVTVLAGSEKCYLFIQAIESKDLTTFLEYEIAGSNGWAALDTVPGVYFQVVESQKEIPVLKGNQLKTKAETTEIPANPTLTFKAYAIQFDGIADASTAWEQVYKIASPKSPTDSETP